MNKPAWIFGTLSLLLAALILSQLAQPAAPCAQADATVQSDEVLEAQLAQVRSERDRLETVVDSLRAAPDNALAPKPPEAAPSAPNMLPPMAARIELSERSRRLSQRLRNGQIFGQLGLSEAQIESLLDLMVAREKSAVVKPGSMVASADPALRARHRAEVAALIGPERAEQLETWQGQMMARFDLRRVRDQLEDAGEPLSDAQLSRMRELMRTQPVAAPPLREPDETPEAFMARHKAWRSDAREQARKQFSEVLEPRQLERYDQMDEVQREFEKSLPARMTMPTFQAPPPAAGQAAPPARP